MQGYINKVKKERRLTFHKMQKNTIHYSKELIFCTGEQLSIDLFIVK